MRQDPEKPRSVEELRAELTELGRRATETLAEITRIQRRIQELASLVGESEPADDSADGPPDGSADGHR